MTTKDIPNMDFHEMIVVFRTQILSRLPAVPIIIKSKAPCRLICVVKNFRELTKESLADICSGK